MKKYIFIALAAAGTMACSKLTPVDSIPVTELPEDETTETVAPKKGETITIQLAQTKVTLDKTVYVFEGNEQIVVKAGSDGPVATISNSTEDPYTFTGVFETPLGKENPSFDFYYNCTDASGKPNYEQNGQPWLEHKGVTATRATDGGYAYYVVERVQLRQPKGYVALAISSGYDCTVSFNTLQKDPQTVGKTIEGIAVSKDKPYFVNVSKEDLTEGFYLAVNIKGETGTMYTSYGTTAPITSNQVIKIKEKFEAFSITGEVDTDSSISFMSTYDLYSNSQIDKANDTPSDILSSGIVNFPVTGISKSLLTFKSIQIIFSDGVEVSTTEAVEWVNKTLKVTIPLTTKHNKLGEVKISSVTAYFSTPDNDNLEVKANATSFIRYITGMPYNARPTKDTWDNSNIEDWNSMYGGVLYKSNGYIQKEFWVPAQTNIKIIHEGRARKGTRADATTFQIFIGTESVWSIIPKDTTYDGQEINIELNNKDIVFSAFSNWVKCTSSYKYLSSTYATTSNIKIQYR